jgi:hypothetical protein
MQMRDFLRLLPVLQGAGYFQSKEEVNMAKSKKGTLGEVVGDAANVLHDSSSPGTPVVKKTEEYIPLWRTSRGYHRISDMNPHFTALAINQATRKFSEATTAIRKASGLAEFWRGKLQELNAHLNELDMTYEEALREDGEKEEIREKGKGGGKPPPKPVRL